MTLIAGFLKGGCPILMGDLLVSSSDNSAKEICLPTIGKISNSHLSNGIYRPTKLCQKVNLLGPKLAIAWAGTMSYAKDFMQNIIAKKLHNNPERDALRDTFAKIGDHEKLSVICLYRNGKEICMFDFNASRIEPLIKGFEWFKAAGSGYDALLDIASNLESNTTSGHPNKLEEGITSAVGIAIGLISDEIRTGFTLQNLFGAGYEILHPLGRDLTKLCYLTYLFWSVEEEAQGVWKLQPFPFLASKYTYHGDILIIRSVRLSSNIVVNSCKIDSDELHAISPIYRIVDIKELVGYTPSSLNSKMMCNVFLYKNYSGREGAFATFGYYTTQPPPVKWTNEFKSNEGVDINMEFVQSSISKISKNW